MSRTIRRKGIKTPEYFSHDWVKGEDGAWKRIKYEGKRLDKANTFYHSNTYRPNGPKAFRKVLDRTKRAKEKAVTSMIRKSIDNESITYDLRKKDLNWNWW